MVPVIYFVFVGTDSLILIGCMSTQLRPLVNKLESTGTRLTEKTEGTWPDQSFSENAFRDKVIKNGPCENSITAYFN